MESVGAFKERNDLAKSIWSRDRLLKSVVGLSDPIIFDVGAHHGESALLFRRLFPSSTIFSFEPDPDSFKILSSLSLSNYYPFNLAVSDKAEPAVLYRNAISHTNSLYPVNYESKDSISFAESRNNSIDVSQELFNNRIIIASTTLDDEMSRHGINHVSLLKIDVQGAELLVLRGATKLLSLTGAILLEVALFDYYENTSSFLSIEQILDPLGFSLYAITDISQNPMNGRTDWVEALYLPSRGRPHA